MGKFNVLVYLFAGSSLWELRLKIIFTAAFIAPQLTC